MRDCFIRGGAAVFVLCVAGASAIWALDLNLRIAAASAVCGLVVLAICLVLARSTILSASQEFFFDDEEEPPRQPTRTTSRWLQDPDLQNLITLNRTQMQVYHELATNQATYASRNSRRAMLVGFLLLVTGGVVALRADDQASKVVVGALAALGSLLSGYIGQTFLRAEDRAMERLNFYFQQPLVTSYMLAAERLTLKLADNKRDTILSDVIKQVLGAARTAEVAPSSDDRRGNGLRASRRRARPRPTGRRRTSSQGPQGQSRTQSRWLAGSGS